MPPPEPTPDPLSAKARLFTLTPSRLTLANVSQEAAALSAPHYFTGEIRTVPLDRDIHVVFERQRDHVLRRQI
jgi:hypothetical protein